jgi:hypothetical protein
MDLSLAQRHEKNPVWFMNPQTLTIREGFQLKGVTYG